MIEVGQGRNRFCPLVVFISALLLTLFGICEACNIIGTSKIGRGHGFRSIIVTALLIGIDELVGRLAEDALVGWSLAAGGHVCDRYALNPAAYSLVCGRCWKS